MSSLYYFAYGSNLHPLRFRQRVPSARVVANAVLPGHQLVFDKHGGDDSGKCTIMPGAAEVQGVVYEMEASERPELDILESGYECCERVVNTFAGAMPAFVYIARAEMIIPGLLPYHWYKLYVLLGARQHGLDPHYCRRIEAQAHIDDPHIERQRQHFQILGIE